MNPTEGQTRTERLVEGAIAAFVERAARERLNLRHCHETLQPYYAKRLDTAYGVIAALTAHKSAIMSFPEPPAAG